MDFYQTPPVLKNTYISDPWLKPALKSILPPEVFSAADSHLKHVGELAATTWKKWAEQAEQEEPRHVPFDPWGRRIDHIEMSKGWSLLEKTSAVEGIIATAYDRQWGEYARVYQAALMYLFHPSSAFVSCPLAMTDGAARVMDLSGDQELKSFAQPHFLSRDPSQFWTAGQWMTERTGGSDVSMTSTIARKSAQALEWRDPQGKGRSLNLNYELEGVKWFTSATTAPCGLALARVQEPGKEPAPALSLFYVQLRNPEGALDGIEVLRLKDKLGTRALPTAELKLLKARARMIGAPGEGVKRIASVLNITRVTNAICSVGHWRRALDLAWDYSKKRKAFGRLIVDHPLHLGVLTQMEESLRDQLCAVLQVAHWLGKEEVGSATADEKSLLRAMTPILKLTTARKCFTGVSECVEVFAGAGYVEDTGIPRLLRDAQVFSIWEGTTSVLSLDFVRAVEKENSLESVMKTLESALPKGAPVVDEWSAWKTRWPQGSLSDSPDLRQLCMGLGEWLGVGARAKFLSKVV